MADVTFVSQPPSGHLSFTTPCTKRQQALRSRFSRSQSATSDASSASLDGTSMKLLASALFIGGFAPRRRCGKTLSRRIALAKRAALSTGVVAPSTEAGALNLSGSSDEFVVAVLGDLHIDPRKMDDYHTGRDHIRPILQEANSAVVSLGDLGESKSVRPEETAELFAGTTECHEMASEFLSSFGVPYEVIGGNHDLEGLDEFSTDEANLEAFLRIHDKPTPQFSRLVADKTLLVGLGSTVFRSAKYTSHEVSIDDGQVRWFEELLESKPASEGWKIFVFSHAPPIGSGLRVLQENHVVNGCCWLNHTGNSAKFIELVRKHRCIKGWFSGHFHLGQDYQDSITFPTVPRELGPYPNRGSCVFAQTSVMRAGTSRDKRQQSRLLRGNKDGFEICTINHADGGSVRLDATIRYSDCNHEVGVYAHEHAELSKDNDKFIKVYSPSEGDECYVQYEQESREPFDLLGGTRVNKDTIAWWKMSCGRVLGIYDGRLVEYEPSTLAPLGLVVGQDELDGKRVVIVESGLDECKLPPSFLDGQSGMEGADCADAEPIEQTVMLVDERGLVTVVQPNEDGSYWRKIVRNKMIRMKESRRVKAAKLFALEAFPDTEPKVVSSWGPYTSIVGTAKTTGVAGLTSQAKIAKAWDQLSGGRVAAWREMADELKAVFDSLDKDGNGSISTQELRQGVKQLDPSCDEGWIMDMMTLADKDGSGEVSLEEFARLMLFQRIRTDDVTKEQVLA